MKWDRLLEWMSHMGSGTWETFREIVDGLSDEAENDGDRQLLHRNLRIALSDFGHADFFVSRSRRWRTRRPALIGLSHGVHDHVFAGGRTARLARGLMAAARSADAVVATKQDFPELSQIHIRADPDRLAKIAQELGVDYLRNGAATLATHLSPLQRQQKLSTEAEEPIGWDVRSWSFVDSRWVEGRLHRSLREYSNRYGVRRYLVDVGRGKPLREVERRAGMYYAASSNRISLINYSEHDETLQIPRWAPLPPEHARVACLAGGRLATLTGSCIVFHGVSYRVASVLLASLGQGPTMPRIVQ